MVRLILLIAVIWGAFGAFIFKPWPKWGCTRLEEDAVSTSWFDRRGQICAKAYEEFPYKGVWKYDLEHSWTLGGEVYGKAVAYRNIEGWCRP